MQPHYYNTQLHKAEGAQTWSQNNVTSGMRQGLYKLHDRQWQTFRPWYLDPAQRRPRPPFSITLFHVYIEATDISNGRCIIPARQLKFL